MESAQFVVIDFNTLWGCDDSSRGAGVNALSAVNLATRVPRNFPVLKSFLSHVRCHCPFAAMAAQRPVSNTVQFVLRSGLTLGSLFTGASVVHYACKPDLTLPSLEPPKPPPPVEGYIAASAFQGVKPGFVFKSDTMGLGYYPDSAQYAGGAARRQ